VQGVTVGSGQVDHGVSVAAQPPILQPAQPGRPEVELDPGVWQGGSDAFARARRRSRIGAAAVETAEDKARPGTGAGCKARQLGRVLAAGQGTGKQVQIDPAHGAIEIGELGGHARVDLDDRQTVRCRVPGEFHVEQTL